MEFHALTPDGRDTHICTTHRLPKDDSPVQIISDQQLAHYQRVEAAYWDLLQVLAGLLAGAPRA